MGLTLTKETAQQLLQHSQEILDSFRSADMAVDAHANQYFDGVLPRDDPVRVTIVEIFAGCIRYEKALDTVITAFYNVEGRVVKRSEQNLYRGEIYTVHMR
uniref:SnoaL-like domain-containing protein n=1 Tax=Macrostomum lignano TaxID=282301 RepID=A0A1I8IEK0_9PLAT